jgi:hypothetical protein
MKITLPDEQVSKLSALQSSKTPISITLEIPLPLPSSSAGEVRLLVAKSKGAVVSASHDLVIFSLHGDGGITLPWSAVDECDSMSPLGEPHNRCLEFKFKNRLRLFLAWTAEKQPEKSP